MRVRAPLALVSLLLLTLVSATVAQAAVSVVMGPSWDGPANSLQAIVDALYGAGKIDVATDYLGAKPGDEDPWFWVDDQCPSLLLREVAGYANRNQVGWYEETGAVPVLVNDGVHDGLVLTGAAVPGTTAFVAFAKPRTRFGFYLDRTSPQPVRFYTNRKLNATSSVHAPYDGDVQALVYDVSRWTVPNTWLVCFEDLDSGPMPGPLGSAATDNDYNDLVFQVTAFGATPARLLTLGALKHLYAH